MSKYITSNLYATLRDNGINMPTEEVFYKNMSDPNYRKTLHKGLQDKGFDLDDIREFQVHWHNKFANDANYKGKDEVTSKPVAQQPKQQSQPTQQSSQRMLSGQRVPKQQHIERVETTRSATPKAVTLYTPNTKSQIKTNEDVALESQPKIERPKVDNTEQATKLKSSIETQQDEIKAKIEDAERRRMEAVREYNKKNRFLSAFVASAQQDTGVDPFASGAYGEEVTKITEEIQSLRNQLKRMTDAHDKIATALETKKGDGLFDLQNFKNIGRGIADTFTDADFWDMGRGEFNANTQMMGISKKIEQGKELTDDELNVVSTELINQSVDQYIQSIGGLPIGYSVGQVTAEATRFMLEMGINPARGASSAITQQLVKKLGVDGIKNIIAKRLATGAIKAVGNVAEAGALVNTMQSMRTAGDAAKRYAGTIDIDNDGNLTVVDNQGMGEALYKAEASAIIENVTELMGGGKLAELTNKGFNAAVKRLGDVISLGKISDFAGKMSATSFGRFVDGMAKRGAWQGFADEVFEEEYGIMLNSLLVGDSSFSDLVDPKQQAEIVLGCAFMDGSIKAIKIGGGAIEYRNISKKYRKAESKAKSLFTPEQWEMISSNLGGATDAEIGALLATYLDPNTGLSPEQRQAVAEYAGSMVRYRSFNRMTDNVKEESKQQSSVTTPTPAYEVDSDVSLIDDNGDTINGHITGVDEDGNYIVETNTLVNGMRVQPLSADQLDAMGNTNGGEIVDGVQTSTAEGYDITDFDQIGELSMLVDNSRDDVAQALGTTDVDAVLQQALGNNPTDTDIDAQFGDNAQVVKEYVHNRAKLNGSRQRNDDDLDIAIESIDSDIANIANTNGNVVAAKMVSEDGDVYVVDGNIVTYEDGQIDVANSDASVIIQKADGSREMVTPLQLQDIASTPTEQYRDELVQAFTDNHRQAYNDAVNSALNYSQGQQYTMLNSDGSTTDVTIIADNGDGNVTVTARDGNKEGGVTDGKQIVLPKSQIQQGVREFKRNQLRQAKAQQVKQTKQPQQVTDTSEATPKQTPSATKNIAPRDEQGNVLYGQMSADNAWDMLVEESGGDTDIATMVAQSNIEDAQKALDKAKKQTPKLVGTTEEKLATAKAFKESVVKAQNDLAKWQEIADVPKRRASLQTEQTDLQTELQTESQGQQVADKLPASEEVGSTETTPVEEVAQIEESAPIEEQTKGNGSTMSQETDQVEEENRLAEEAERKRIEEEKLAKEEAERIAKEAEAKRLAEEQAKEEERKRIEEENRLAEEARFAKEEADRQEREQRLAEEKAKKERDEFAETVIDNIKKAFDHFVDESKNEIESRNIEDEISQLSDDTIAQTIEEIENTPELSDVLIQIKELVLNGKITGTAKEEQELADGVEKIAQGSVSKNYILPKLKAEQEKRNSENAVAPESEQVGYSITPATYVTKANKVLDMHLLVFDRPLGKEEHKSAREIAKSLRGWYDAKEGGYMMRSEEDAKSLANAMLDKEVVENAQPVSLSDVNDFIAEEPKKESKPTEAKPSNPSGNKLVTDERYAELRERMRKKLGGQMNMGIDPEILAIGTEMAVYHIEKGARKFKDYATDMIADLGDAIRPYLKAFYNGARELPEVEDAGFVNDMTPYEEVKSFDVANFDKVVPNPLDTADAIAKEAEVEKQAEEANEKIKDARNDKRVEFINNLHSGDRVILKDGRNVLISIVMHRGEQVLVNNAFGYTKPTAERFYATYKGELIDFTPDKIDVDATLKFREDLTSKTSESTEKSVPLQDNKLHREFVKAVTTDMLSALDTNERPYRSIVDIRKRAKEVGIEVDNEGRDDILLQELVEDGLVRAARLVNISWGGAKYSRRSFDEICQLYAMQPTIAQRSSNRIKMQQYSTPLPMAWVANLFAMLGKKDGKVLEPTAGNGMLVFSIPPKQVHVNELDETRLANLREQGFAEVTQQDATEPFEGGKQYDVILANPPFGKRDAVEFDGDKISGLDPQITLNALDAMKDNGRAAIIIGGNFEYRPNGAIKDKPAFWSHLYNHYNVVGVVDMSGDMYARQGTTFPTRMILINGRRSEEDRKQGTCYPPVQADAVRKAETFDDLYEIVNELIEFNLNNKTNGTIISSEGLPSKPVSDKPQGKTGQVGHRRQSKKGDSSIEQVQRGLDSGTENPLVAVLGNDNANGEQSRPDKREDDRSGNQGDDVRVELEGGNATEGSGVRTRTDSADGGRHGGIGRQGLVDSVNDNIGTSSLRSSDVLVERKLDTEKLPYRPHNTAFSLESVAPAHMVEAMDAVLSDIESQYGNIDQFVTDELGYNSVDEMHNALAAEQVDSVAMAIYQMKQGKAMIIGDQTGVGKGRQMASLIRWAVKQGKTPIFATQKADLFSDIYRDLVDIGSGNLIPFIFNARTGKNKGEMVDANGEVVHRGLPDAKMKEVLKAGVLPEGYDFVVLTYSQVNNGPEHPKAKLLANIAKDNYLFLDESHTAAGESKTGECFQNAVASAKAVTFASATYAKRPDTMPLYALRTSMNEANVGMDELIDIIKRGGVTLQEIMSRELTNAGQMVRRERDMSDVVTDWVIVDDAKTSQVARDNYDRTINAFNAIIKFQEDYVNPTLKGESEKVAREMKSISKTKGTDKVGIDNTPFASHTFNYTKQLMLALKVDAIIDYVDREIKAGRHPVIALENTMESSYKDFNDGEELDDTSFSRGLLKGLDSTLKYTINNSGDKIPGILYPYQLIGDGEAKYYELQKFIYESTKDIFISPLDAIIDGLHKKGYRVGELTGRSKVVSIEGDKAVVRNRKDTDKKKLQREFNSGLLDVLILNKSAATGISLHASERFSDQRQRTMILVQPLSDINDYMQMIGRIDRTGQVHRGYYINLGLPIPAENRFLMMLSTKLKSLNANTTTSQDSESNEVKAPDLLNKYGGQVIIEYLRDNPDVYVKIGEPLSGVSVDDLETYTANDETASKITGRVALLTIKEQEDFYDDVIRRYNDLINYLNDTGTNDLKINVVPLRAETIAKRVTSKGKDPNGNNPFAQDAYLEKVEMDVIRKPMKSAEVQKTIEKVNDGLSHDAHLSKIADIVTAETSAKVDKEVERHNKATERVNAEIESHTKKVNKMDKLSEEEKQKVIEDYANTKIADIADKHSANLSKLRDAQKVYFDNLKLFTTGDTYLIPDNLETLTYSTLSPAIFCGYKTKDSKITASTTFAVFAVLDGRRKIEIKLSEMSKLKNIYYATMQNIGTAKSTDLSNWDSQMPNETRREGYILTGNILQAVADTMDENGNYTGQLVSYTDIDGNVRDGVLMPDNWNPKLLKSGKAPLISKLTQIKNGERVESSDGDVVIAKNRWGYTYTLSVPKTKKRGGKFFEDAELLNLVSNGVFYPNRGRLQADVISERIDRVVQRLTELDVKVEAEKSEDDVMFRASEEIEAEYRQGEGAYTDAEVSFANDLVSRAWGENIRSKKQQQSFANRIRKQMRQHAQSLAETLRVPIEILDNPNGLTGKKARAKGFYDKKTEKATVILSNNNSLEDIEATVLHELVGHYGLRELFGENFDRFLYNVYTHAEADVKERINRLARKNNWDFAKATEEYLASLAEDESIYRNSQDQTRWLFKIKRFFMEMLRTLGFNYLGPSLSDNELKYVLWCSYQNLQGELNPIFKTASDVAMQSALKVGQFEEQTPKRALASESREFDNEPDVLLRDTEDSVARDMYERKLASTAYQSTEAFQDSMLGLKVFQDAVLEANGKGKEAIADFENAYMAENALSSKNYAQTEEFKNRLFIPLVTEMAKLEPSGEYGGLYDYMMAKHGLERNRVMAERDAEAFFENYEGEETFEEILAKFRKNDYSGLTSLTGEEDVESAEEIAYHMVEDYENSHNTSALWDKINACTADILKKQFEGGLISRDTYNQISAMYENYIPLRGWKETTADDVYTYLTSKSGAFNAPIRTARGRSSVADNPIATIAHMAESGIAQANRNKLKQQFYNFCLNNPSNLASISDVWLQHNPVTDEWEVVSPQIDADATAEEVEQIMSDFNERMKSLAEENPDEYKKGSQAKGIPYKIGKGVLSEHQVLVKVNGKDIIITINGNPRAAQAVNGLTNPDSEMSGAIGNLLKLTNYVNRQLSAFYTTRNPEFVVSNFFRDAIYANSMVWVKESPNYAVKFNSNFGKVNPAKMHQLIRKYRNGSLDMSNEIEKAFYDFMINGGETGYTQMKDLEAHKKELDKALKYSQGKMPVRKAWNMFFDRCDEINRAVENCARFAAFVTSRQMGRTIQRSVYDAKEISVNFNKKGAGDKFLKSNNATAKWASLISGAGRMFYVFWNAGIQGMANFAKASKNNPKDAILACAAMFLSGALVAMLGYDDEERDYYNLPEYVRRSNLCFKVGNSWVTIPLPIEFRAIYGLGELCASVINGGDKYTPKETAEKVAQQFSQLLPLDMLEGGGGWNPLIPTFAKPWAEAYVFNTDWTGLPIYKENTFNELDPEFTKAYKNTNDILVGISEYLNSIDLGRNGNAAKKGDIDINPAKLEYVLEGYFGGLATTFNKMVKMGETAFGDREFEWRNMLIASRLVKEGDERQEAKRVQNQYYNYKQEAEETSNQLSHFRGEKRKGILDNADELDFLHHSPEYLRYTIFNEYDDDITALNKKIKEMPDGKEKDNLVIELDALRKELVDQLDATRDLTKEDVKQITTTDPNVNYYRAKEEDADYKEVEIDPLDERFKNATTEEQAEIQKEIDAKMETEGFNHWSNVHDALNAISNTKRAIKSGEAPKNYNDTIHNIKKEIADMRRSYFGNNGLKNKEEGEQ